MKPGDYQGYSSDTMDDAAMTAFLVKHPEEIGAELEMLRTDSCILIRRRNSECRKVNKLDRHSTGDHPDIGVPAESRRVT